MGVSTTVCCKTFKCYGALSSFQLLLKSVSQPAVVLELHISNIKVSHWRSPLGHLWAYLKPTWSLLGANMVHPGAHLAPSVHPKRQLDGTLLKVSHQAVFLGVHLVQDGPQDGPCWPQEGSKLVSSRPKDGPKATSNGTLLCC